MTGVKRLLYLSLSFLLSLGITTFVVGGLYWLLKPEPEPKPIVVRAVLVTKEKRRALYNYGKGEQSQRPQREQQISKAPEKGEQNKGKVGSKSSYTHGGDNLDVEDLFKGVKANLPSTPVRQKAQLEVSRFKGNNPLAELEAKLQKLNQTLESQPIIENPGESGETITDKEVNEIYQKMREVWEEVYTLPGQSITMDVTYKGGRLYIHVIKSNLPPAIQQELIYKLKQLIFTKEFTLRVRFIAKKGGDSEPRLEGGNANSGN
jgi:hypothetical protein